MSERVSALELMRTGGRWLGAVRDRVKWIRCHGNGESVTWGSGDTIRPPLTILEVETLAAEAVAADRNERGKALAEMAQQVCDLEAESVRLRGTIRLHDFNAPRYKRALEENDELRARLAELGEPND